MIVLPNSFEKYLYSLRIYTSISILKHGVLPRHLKKLKKIYLAEAFLFKKHKQPTDLQLLSYNLLYCVKNIKKFDFTINANEKVLINQNLYTALLLTLPQNIDFINIKFNNGIILKGNGEINNSKKIISYLKGYSIQNLKSNDFLVYIPCKKTNLSPTPTISQWELLFDKFSVFNLFWK